MGLQARNPFENGELDDVDLEAPDGLEPLRGEAEVSDEEARAREDADLEPIELTDIHHVGIAVADLDEAVAQYRDLFGATVQDREALVEQDLEVALLEVGPSRIALIAGLSEDSWITEFLDGQGSGIYQVGFQVADVAAALADLGGRGWELVDEEPQVGVARTRTAYVHPPDEPGTLIQLVELP
jgi:methylmalonyl-CoA/ethylmalonyl-CoA epimerase